LLGSWLATPRLKGPLVENASTTEVSLGDVLSECSGVVELLDELAR
jgi:hypothetical protein